MYRKPPTTRTGRSGWLGRRSTRFKSLAVVGTVTLGFAGAALLAAVPASADPSVQFVEVGSDTTQFMMDQFAGTVGDAILGSYDAVNPLSNQPNEVITPQKTNTSVGGAYSSCTFTRPNGSGGGFKAMTYAMTVGPGFPGTVLSTTTSLGQNGTPPEQGCIDLSRSSSAPGSVSGSTGSPGSLDDSGTVLGNYVYIPYAADAVTYATGPTSVTTAAYSYTATMATPAVFTATGSAYANGTTVELSGTVPGGFTAGNIYYVVGASGTSFSLASTFNGTAIASTSAVTTGGTVQFFTTTLCQTATTGCSSSGQITFNPQATTIPQGMDLTQAQLETLYKTCASLTVTTPTGNVTLNPGSSFAVTAPVASPAVFTTATASNLTANQEVTLEGTLSTGLSSQTVYYVLSTGLTATTFELATSPGGTAVNTTGTTATAGSVTTVGNVDLYAPQPGSGTLAFWESTMGTGSAPASCWRQVIVAGPAIGIPVEEHDGSALASDQNGIEPMSIARWVSGSNGVTPDLRHEAVLQAVTAVVGTTSTVVEPLNANGTINLGGCTLTGFTQSACFPFQRELYNVMDFYEVVSGSTPPAGTINNPAFNPLLSSLFSGSTSLLCRSTFTISNNGFEPLFSGSSFTDPCGSTANTLRVQMNNNVANG